MSDLQKFIEENRQERERLLTLMAGLKEADFAKKLPNGWTIGVALAHLAFWDMSQTARLKRWLEQGITPPLHRSGSHQRPLGRPFRIPAYQGCRETDQGSRRNGG